MFPYRSRAVSLLINFINSICVYSEAQFIIDMLYKCNIQEFMDRPDTMTHEFVREDLIHGKNWTNDEPDVKIIRDTDKRRNSG